ncbi:Snd2p [Sporobolomyces salmoneus]|uniref:Snd2p n=1 Tax=Sporobolomyces salmoneus TaxID=183962 RepID=UPI00317E3BE4
MAGANSKRIASENAKQLTLLRLGTAVSSIIYILHLFIFSSGRTKWRIFMFVATLTSELSTWQQLETMASRGQAIFEGKGLIQYMFDLIYITWFVHVATALVWAKFWYLFWVIPGYGLYKLSSFFFPQLFSSLTGTPAPASTRNGITAPAAGVQDGVTNEILSKRQEKLKKRVEKGDPRAIAKNQEKQMLQQRIEKQNAAKTKNQD